MKTVRTSVTLVICLILICFFRSFGLAADPCGDLKGKQLGGATITDATPITPPWTSPASSLSPPTTISVPFCRIEAVVAPAIRFEVWMPQTATWNGRFLGVGNGALAGGINYGPMKEPLRNGFATASTDAGHVSGPFDGSWAIGHPNLINDWAVRAPHVMTVAAKAILEAYYSKGPKYSYFSGCSGGGRQALREAQDFPEDFDGILAGAPALHETHMIPGMLWNAIATCEDPASYLPPSKLPAIARAVLARCDAIDGVVDGLINDPRLCDFDPKTIQCEGPDALTCLTAPQVKALKEIYQGARTPQGTQIYPGYLMGGETGPGGWASWITGSAPKTSFDFLVADSYFKYMIFENPNWEWTTSSFDEDVDASDAELGYINANKRNLRAFKARGGKLIMYHGWSDPAITPLDSIDYYWGVTAFMSGLQRNDRKLLADGPLHETQEFFRLYMMPGMQHCMGGSGPDTFDGLGTLQKWVEDRVAPDRIVATHYTDGAPDRTRPLCPYPAAAKWTGKGSTDDAANFVCVINTEQGF